MHDETFLVTQGTVRFHVPSSLSSHTNEQGGYLDAKSGDYVVVPIRAPHTFSNPFDEEAKFVNTYTPAFYINYFKMLTKMAEGGKPMDPEINKKAMASFATLPADLKNG